MEKRLRRRVYVYKYIYICQVYFSRLYYYYFFTPPPCDVLILSPVFFRAREILYLSPFLSFTLLLYSPFPPVHSTSPSSQSPISQHLFLALPRHPHFLHHRRRCHRAALPVLYIMSYVHIWVYSHAFQPWAGFYFFIYILSPRAYIQLYIMYVYSFG